MNELLKVWVPSKIEGPAGFKIIFVNFPNDTHNGDCLGLMKINLVIAAAVHQQRDTRLFYQVGKFSGGLWGGKIDV